MRDASRLQISQLGSFKVISTEALGSAGLSGASAPGTVAMVFSDTIDVHKTNKMLIL